MKDDRLLDDDDLKAAFRSIRDAYDGTSPEANTTLQRALFRTRTRERRSRLTRWVVLPIAAVLAASTAWAGVTGKLTPAMEAVLETFHAERAPRSAAHAQGPSTAIAAASPSSEPVEPVEEAPPSEVAEATPSETAAPSAESTSPPESARPAARPPAVATTLPTASASPVAAQPPVADAPAPATEPAPVASAPDPHAALFAEAHRLHFIDRDPARALAAWDRYLVVAPDGRFAPEARYNRALALVRLGRVAEARSELDVFASGRYGSYRREEARALLGALAADAARP